MNLESWFIKKVDEYKEIEDELNDKCLRDDDDGETEYHRLASLDDNIKYSRDHLSLERTWLNEHLRNEHKPAQHVDMIGKIKNIIKMVKNGDKIGCHCGKGVWQYRTGKFGEFIYCPFCKCTTSESTIRRYQK